MLQQTWKSLPSPLARILAVSTVGHARLVGLAEDVSRLAAHTASNDERARLGAQVYDLLFAAWEQDPLNGSLAAALTARADGGRMQRPAPGLEHALDAVAGAWAQPQDNRYVTRLMSRGDFGKLRTHALRQLRTEPGNPYWPQLVLHASLLDGQWTALADEPHLFQHLPAPLAASLTAYTQLLLDRPEQAAPLLESLLPLARSARWAMPMALLGEARLRTGDAKGGMNAWADALRACPWNTNLALALHDRIRGLDAPAAPTPDGAPLDGSLRILFYTWNKADELHEALASVAASITRYAPGSVGITVLDNGSTDATPQVINAWKDRFGAAGGSLFEAVRLPVNVGAPAARNWLAAMDSVTGSDYALYLDDDVEVPQEWLGLLARAVTAYPDADVWGCRVVDHGVPLHIQNADLHLSLAGDFGTGTEDPDAALRAEYEPGVMTSNPFDVSDAHCYAPDTGQFRYIRPCASVTGCCHLMRTASLSQRFNLSLSPSQYDDFERDLANLRNGGYACYQGFLRVRHKRRTGAQASLSPSQRGNSLANKYKLHHLYPPETILAMRETIAQRVEQDLLAKLDFLDQSLDEFLTRD